MLSVGSDGQAAAVLEAETAVALVELVVASAGSAEVLADRGVLEAAGEALAKGRPFVLVDERLWPGESRSDSACRCRPPLFGRVCWFRLFATQSRGT